MHVNVRGQLTMASALALAVTAWACNGNSSRNTARDTNTAAAPEGTSVSLSGCVQETTGLRGNYILTQVNREPRTVGTSGGSGSNDTVGREQRQAAAKRYRLDGDSDQLRGMVGEQVRIAGRVTDNSDLSKDKAAQPNDASADRDISTSDLAKVKVDSISKIADSCEGGSAR